MNKITLVGRLTKDVELTYTSNNTAVGKFTLAVNRRFKKQGEEQQADFINQVAFGKLAETCSNFLKKGSQVAISGRLEINTYDDKEGNRQYFTNVIVEELTFCDSKGDKNGKNDKKTDTKESEGFYPVEEDDEELPF